MPKPIPRWLYRITAALGVASVAISIYGIVIVAQAFWSARYAPTYSQVCAPLAFIRKIDYYGDRTFVVCGSSTTEPILKEYPRQ